jgi:PRTRC genetic system protein A
MNNMDKAILNAFPLVAVPTSEPLPGHTQCGTRYLVGKAGLMREITLPWIRLVHSVATCDADITLPYGTVGSSAELWCSEVPAELIAAALIWNSTLNEWRYAIRRSLRATPGYVSFEEVRLGDDEHLVVDIHSHGMHRAYFSSTDDEDDYGAMKFSVVLGNLDKPTPSSAIRLCMAGRYFPASINELGVLGVVL